MRLLHIERLEFAEFRADNIPPYVIASHRWREDSEVTFQDMQNRHNTDRYGYKKIKAFTSYIQDHIQHVEWLWIDTCCIDKTNAAELSESINLMFKWYYNAEVCLAYLADVKAAEEGVRLENSEWLQRGWTLQELLAPRVVIFISKDWETVGNKGAFRHYYSRTFIGPGLEKEIAAITGIPERVLHDYDTSQSVSITEKLNWIEGRITTRPEDMSYALYGICGVTLGANYGEGYEGARQRLLTAMNYRDNLAAQQAKNYREIMNWLSPPDPWVNHQTARGRHEPQTGAWLLESSKYEAWKSASIRHLWLTGKPGCGKTILCSTAIEDVKSHCEGVPNDGYAVFYFSFSDDGKERYEDLIRSLVVQVGWRKPGLKMLAQEYKKPNRKVPGTDVLEKIVLCCIESYDTFFFLLDALDESPEENDARQDILKWLTKLPQKASNLKVLATSRELPDIRASMAILGAETISIATKAVDKDIQRYVAMEMSSDPRLSRLNRETKMLIEETLLAKAGGVFRWAYCQLQELKKLKVTRPSMIAKALNTLPTTLDETYERILLSINEDSRVDGLKLLRWLAYAKSPPRLSELVDVAVIDLMGNGSVDEEDRPRLDDPLEILSGLIVVESYDDLTSKMFAELNQHNQILQQVGRDTRVRLAHFSVKEYLESQRIRKSAAREFHLESGREHRVITQSCLVYLSHYSNSRDKLSSMQDFTTFPLLEYAAKSWFYHAGLQETVDHALEVRFLCDIDFLHNWILVYKPDDEFYAPFHQSVHTPTGLYYASFLGLDKIVSQLLVAGADVDAWGGKDGNPLQVASFKGNEKVVQMLLAAGADVNAKRGVDGNALQGASHNGHEKIVQMLLAAGADVNAQKHGRHGSALRGASRYGYEKIVQMLLAAGADVNAQEDGHGSALRGASRYGHEKIVQMLLAAGADVNAKRGFDGNALQVASCGGNEKVVQILLAAGADVDAHGGRDGNALQAASYEGNEEVVRILLAAGADVNAQGRTYSNALQAALYGGNEKVVQILLAAGADVNAKGRRHGNALQVALYEGNEKLVQILLAAGADVNAWEGRHGNALQATVYEVNEKAVQILLAAGVDLNAPGGTYSNALQAALYSGCNEKIVQMLLAAGADINA